MNLLHTARIGALSAALVLCSSGPAGAVDPAPGLIDKRTPAGIAATCSTYGYACPTGLTCKFIAGPPQKMPPWDYVAYSCEVSGFVVPGGCPSGYVKSATGCKPGPKACAASVAKNQWHWTTGTLPLTSGTGYRCPYKHFTLQG